MPEFHEIMNIFADKGSGGEHPSMPSVDTVTGVPWLTHGRYHFAETDHIIHGFDFENIDIWWDWKETTSGYTTQATPGGGQSIVPYTHTKTDYAGYKIETELWEGAESPEQKFRTALLDLRNVAVAGTSVESTSYATSTHWKIAVLIAQMDDFFLEQQELLLEKVRKLHDPDAPIQGNAANMFANHLFNLGSRLENLSTQLDRFHNAVNDIRPRIIPAIANLDGEVTKWDSGYTSIYDTIYLWYNHQSNGTQRFNTARDQFEINYADGLWGVIGDDITDSGVNDELHRRWMLGLDPVIKAANNLYDVMSEVYTDITTDIRPITNPSGKNLPGFNGSGSTGTLGGNGGPGGGGDINLPEIDIDIPEIDLSDLPPPTTVGGPGGGGDLPPPPTITGGPGGLGNLPPPTTTSGPGGLSNLPPPTTSGPGNGGSLTDLPPPPTTSGPGSGGTNDLGVPPPLLPSALTAGPGGGSGLPGPNRGALARDPDTGLPIDPDTGTPYPVDPQTGQPHDPDTGLPIALDPETNRPLPIDPLTGQTITTNGPGNGGINLDPDTGLPIDPDTGQPFPINPDTGLPYNPDTGLPVLVDPDTGTPFPINPDTGLPYDPDTGLPIALDPETGRPHPVDPVTGLPIDPETGQPVTIGGPGDGSGLDLPEYDLPRLETPDFDGDGEPGLDLPRYSTVGPGNGSGLSVPSGAGDGSGSGDRSSLFTTPETLNRAAGSPGSGGFMTPPPIGEGAAGTVPPASTAAAPPGGMGGMGGVPPMMPMAGNQNNQERNRSTWLSEDERVWGTSRRDQRSVLGRPPLPGEEKKGSIRERVDTGAGGTGSRTTSQTDGGVRAGKRKPGVGNRRGRVQGPDGGREGERQGGTG